MTTKVVGATSVHHCLNIQAPTLRKCVNVSRTIIFIL
uniref:Uncharacterized protein n=1 Tax=Arundo donax TaxID=35708 RepID=A0A0A9EJR4_ARUDO